MTGKRVEAVAAVGADGRVGGITEEAAGGVEASEGELVVAYGAPVNRFFQ